MTATYLLWILIMAAGLGYTFWMKGKFKQSLAGARPAFQSFFERTGYRYAELEREPLDAQVDRAYREAEQPGANIDLHYVRDFYGIRIHYRAHTWVEQSVGKTTYFRSSRWDADLTQAPRIPIHIANKSLASMMKKVGEALGNSKRQFTPQCSQQIVTGVPAIDDKFVVYGENAEAVRWVFQQNPGLVQLLQNWPEVDVWVTARGGCFNDPSFSNIMAAMGGSISSMAMGFDYGKRVELGIPVHERVAELLATLIRATT
jgi:hypothetical protein